MATNLDVILNKALSRQDISVTEGLFLLQQKDTVSIEAIRTVADELRRQQAGNPVTYVINRNINYTNICEQHCSFCAFRRDPGQEGAYWLDWDIIQEKAAEAVKQGATEICMQGGLNPAAKVRGSSLAHYCKLITTLKDQFPALHIHAFSPQEVEFIAREDNIDFRTVLITLKASGLDSMPGTAAEVLDDSVRKIICPEKIKTQTWLEIITLAHKIGLPTTSTLLSGHIETPTHQINHLDQLRRLQQQSLSQSSVGISEFIILPFVGKEAPKPLRNRVGRDQPILIETLHLTAVARIFLGNWIPNHQPSWVKLGLTGATEALLWGCNDIGGTLMEEHITSMAGAQGGTYQTVTTLKRAIKSLDRSHQQRDTLYQPILNALSPTGMS